MTMTIQEYSAIRAVLAQAEDTMEINRRQIAVFWPDACGVRMLLFSGSHLVWTEWRPTRQDAIDAAFRAAKRHEVRP